MLKDYFVAGSCPLLGLKRGLDYRASNLPNPSLNVIACIMSRNCQNFDDLVKREPDVSLNKNPDHLSRSAKVDSTWTSTSRASQRSTLSPNTEYLEQQRAQVYCENDLDLTRFSQPYQKFQLRPANIQPREVLTQETPYALYSPRQAFELYSDTHPEADPFEFDLACRTPSIPPQMSSQYSCGLDFSDTDLCPAIPKHHRHNSAPLSFVFEPNPTDAHETANDQNCDLSFDRVKTESPGSSSLFTHNVNSLSVSMPPPFINSDSPSINVATFSPSYPRSPVGSTMSLLSPQISSLQPPRSRSDDGKTFGILDTPLGSGDTREINSNLIDRLRPSSPIEPRRQEIRFEEDMYTPRWVRGRGKTKEGWCDLCNNGGWFQLKNSAYWYHKQYLHGICNLTGRPYPNPIGVRQVEGGSDSLEVECGSCKDWISIGIMRATDHGKWGASWYRHAHKVNTPQRNTKV